MSEDAKPAMVCSADDLLGWPDFPKGLRVLLLNEDSLSAAEIKSKLEKMDYDVTTFHNENEALEAISNKDESFHVAMVEMNIDNPHGSFKFLETARDLPIIMISSIHCLSTMMKCIALGATEFLQEPVSEDKLRNIWQHVVHKAFNAGEGVLSKSLKPIKETVASMLQFQTETSDPETGNPFQTENEIQAHELEQYPAPSTPQLERGRLLGDGDRQDEPKCSIKKEIKEQDGKSTMLTKSSCSQSKSVENTWKHHSIDEVVIRESPSRLGEALNEDEVDSAEAMEVDECNTAKESGISSHSQNRDYVESTKEKENQNKASVFPKSSGTRGSRRKMKVDWTQDLHKRFVKAVEQLGIDQAIPSKILELMKVEGLTRHNVASHLQKYRMHRRHIVPKDDERKWWPHRNLIQSGYTHRPLMAYPPYHSNYGIPTTQLYPVWGRPSSHPSNAQIWGHSGYSTWHPPESWPWKTYPEMQADAWGCPVVPPHVPCSTVPQNALRYDRPYVIEGGKKFSENSFDLYPGEEVIDKVVKEVMNQPWLPLPLGLKPPSTESVLTELHRQGIRNVPPYSC